MDQDMCHTPNVLPEMPIRLHQAISKQLPKNFFRVVASPRPK